MAVLFLSTVSVRVLLQRLKELRVVIHCDKTHHILWFESGKDPFFKNYRQNVEKGTKCCSFQMLIIENSTCTSRLKVLTSAVMYYKE